MIEAGSENKSALARNLGVSRSSLYYRKKLPDKDWEMKCKMEEVLREHPSYGHKRLSIALKANKKRILRVMKKFGIKPYRRNGKKWHKRGEITGIYPNLLMIYRPEYMHHIWVADFTHIKFKGKWLYLATVMDLYTRTIVGFAVLANHSRNLVIHALLAGVQNHPRPKIFHSDNGTEYDSEDFKIIVESLGTQISRSAPGCPWENGYQESFYGKFKTDLGDPDRFLTLGEIVYEIYRTIWEYNNTRIHTSLKMSPKEFAERHKDDILKYVEEGV